MYQKQSKEFISVEIVTLQKKTRESIKKLLCSEFAILKMEVTSNCIELICDYILSYNAKLLNTALNLNKQTKPIKKSLMRNEIISAIKIMNYMIKERKNFK